MDDDRTVLFLQHQDDCGPGYLGDRVRELGLATEVAHLGRGHRPHDPSRYALVVALGSDDSTLDEAVPYLAAERAFLTEAVTAEVPVLGVCFGAQLLATVLGARVRPLEHPEIGWLAVEASEPDVVGAGPWLVWHLDAFDCPPDAVQLAATGAAVQAFRQGPHLGVQFHPEATPESADAWATKYANALVAAGTDRSALLAETERRAAESRERAAVLVDGFVGRVSGARPGTILGT